MADFYKFEIGDWNVGTDNLTLEQEAAYLRVVNAIRLYEQPIKHNHFVLCGLWRCNERKAKRILQELINAGKLTVDGDSIINRRAVEDASNLRRLKVERRSAGSRGGVESAKSRANDLKNNDTEKVLLEPEQSRAEQNKIEQSRAEQDCDPADLKAAVDDYNALAEASDWPVAQVLSDPRKSNLKKRLQACGGIDGWRAALNKANKSDFLNNRGSKPFTASLDFLLQESSFIKLMEGNYDNRTHNGNGISHQSHTGSGGQSFTLVDEAARLDAIREGGNENT